MTLFSDRPFVAGSLIGLRAFRVTKHSSLTGIYWRQPFLPGVNLASCATGGLAQFLARYESRFDPATKSEIPHEHELLSRFCTCGFYAYFDGSNDYLDEFTFRTPDPEPRVAGVIEAFGKVVVGSRGFRAEKARLVALIVPPEKEEPARPPRHGFGSLLAYALGANVNDARPGPAAYQRGLAAHYPGVPIYPSTERALAAHPLTVPDHEVVE